MLDPYLTKVSPHYDLLLETLIWSYNNGDRLHRLKKLDNIKFLVKVERDKWGTNEYAESLVAHLEKGGQWDDWKRQFETEVIT